MSRGENLTFGELHEANSERCEQVFHKIDAWTPTDWGCALAGEVGEACNLIKKLRRLDTADKAQDSPTMRKKLVAAIAKELADSVIYIDLTATRLGIDLGKAVRSKFNAVSKKRKSSVVLR